MYVGIVGENATLNGTTITTSNIKNSCEGILATGFPVKDKLNDSNYKERMTLFSKFKKIRMFGTAVISIVLVASGKVDAYYESSIRIWDVAGPLAILKAAGVDKSHIVKLTVFVTDLRGFNYVNESFKAFFSGIDFPARSTVEVSELPLNAKVEIECIAFV
ncbi:MAG: hypothetical protein HON82_04480 [Candidatus Marinimicrobia bacterium]|nr:hypothetical protein [Candidatus Neomarinimicrobiota bacterium]